MSKNRVKNIIGAFILGGIGLYIYSITKQIDDVKSVCSLYPVGAKAEGFEAIEKQYSVKYMGIFKERKDSETEQALFCATLTMCDTSCRLEFKNNVITKSKVSNL